jgi:hypothetical protein
LIVHPSIVGATRLICGTSAEGRATCGYLACRHDSATAAVHTLPGPVGGEPACDRIGQWYVEA